MNNSNIKLRRLVFSALFVALISAFTAYIKVPTGLNQGYIHFGDSLIYLASCLLPFPYAFGAAAISGGLSDLLAGSPIYAISSIIIKACNAIPFAIYFIIKKNKSKNNILSTSTVILSILSGFITIIGYFIAEILLFGFATACINLPLSFIQPLGSSIVFVIFGLTLDKVSFKRKLNIM